MSLRSIFVFYKKAIKLNYTLLLRSTFAVTKNTCAWDKVGFITLLLSHLGRSSLQNYLLVNAIQKLPDIWRHVFDLWTLYSQLYNWLKVTIHQNNVKNVINTNMKGLVYWHWNRSTISKLFQKLKSRHQEMKYLVKE